MPPSGALENCMKYISFVLIIILFGSCSLIIDSYTYNKIGDGFDLYNSTDFEGLDSFPQIADFLREKITYESSTEWKSPKNTYESGIGDCEDIAVLFMNIAYFTMNVKMDLATTYLRSISKGGVINHAELYYDGFIYDIYCGIKIYNRSPQYIYKFYEILAY